MVIHATDLQHAIANIESFLASNETLKVPTLAGLQVSREGRLVPRQESGFAKAGQIFKSMLCDEQGPRELLLASLDMIKKHYPHIVDDEKLSQLVAETIERFNALFDPNRPRKLRDRFASFFYECAGLTLGPELRNSMRDIPPPRIAAQGKKEVVYGQWKVVHTNSQEYQQERELFQMKLVSRLKLDVVTTSWKTPVEVSVQTARGDSVISCEQNLSILPGEVIEFRHAFRRSPDQPEFTHPLPKSFSMVSNSNQTGYPHPSQVAGFTLGERLVPFCPLRLQNLPKFQKIYRAKWNLAAQLLPDGAKNRRAKQSLVQRRKVLQEYPELFLFHHERLAKALLEASAADVQDKALSVIETFFSMMREQPSIDNLSELYAEMNRLFITKLWNAIHHNWAPHIIDKTLDNTKQLLLKKLENTIDPIEHASLSYLLTLGWIIGQAAKPILLQQVSEKLDFSPPTLNEFEKKLQTICYRHLQDFFWDLELSEEEAAQNIDAHHLLGLLQADVELLNAPSTPPVFASAYSVVEELNDYYKTRIKFPLSFSDKKQ